MKIRVVVWNVLSAVLVLEIAVRLFWQNPYVLPEEKAYVHHPNLHQKYYHIDELYADAPEPVLFNTSDFGFIENSKTRSWGGERSKGDFALALGGSTTESGTVTEDRRWADLLDVLTLNFGKSRMYSYNTYYNLLHLLGKKGLRPRWIFVMDGVNNLSHYLSIGPEAFDVSKDRYAFSKAKSLFVLQHVHLAAFLWKLPRQSNFVRFYEFLAARNKRNPVLEDADFEDWKERNRNPIRKTLTKILAEMKSASRPSETKMILLTQPHSYRSDYRPYRNRDLRVFPLIGGKRLSLDQSREAMALWNEATVEAGRELGIPTADVAACFDRADVSDLIYDAWHFTQKGSDYFAQCLKQELKDRNLL